LDDGHFIITYADNQREGSFFWERREGKHMLLYSGEGGVRRVYDERNNASNTCYKVNNKNIKHTGNPKRG